MVEMSVSAEWETGELLLGHESFYIILVLLCDEQCASQGEQTQNSAQ